MISPSRDLSPSAVADHYDELDQFYREVWGDHVHHGLWLRGGESHHEATLQLVRHVAALGKIARGARVCDIGCGYGATARMLAAEYGAQVTGMTISPGAGPATRRASPPPASRCCWAIGCAIRSRTQASTWPSPLKAPSTCPTCADSSHKPGGSCVRADALVVCSWLANPRASAMQRKLLLEPACREGRMSQLGSLRGLPAALRGDRLYRRAGGRREPRREADVARMRLAFHPSDCCASRVTYASWSTRHRRNRVFAVTIFRIWLAFETGALRYGILTGVKGAAPAVEVPS